MAELPNMKALVQPGRTLTDEELRRYSRHTLIPDLDVIGQQRIINAKVLVVGAGGLGSPTIMYLAAAGVGEIGIVDFDRVEASNLQRQIIHEESDIGKSKAVSAKEKAIALNSDIKVTTFETKLDESNVLAIFANYDLIIDGTDNFATRYLINDAAAILGKPYIWGSIYQFDGQASVFWSAEGPCYRCLHPTPPPPGSVPSCAQGGVLGALCAAIGAIQSTEALKLITGIGTSLLGSLIVYDAKDASYAKVPITKSPNCPICNGKQGNLLESYEAFCSGKNGEISAAELMAKFESESDFYLVDVREPFEHDEIAIPDSHLIPTGKFFDGSAFSQLPKDREIVLYCRSGIRSADCLSMMARAGFSNASHLTGGIIEWIKLVERL